MKTKWFRSVLGGMLVMAFTLSLSANTYAMENKDVYFGGTVKETISPFAEVKIRGKLAEMASTTAPTTVSIDVAGKTYIVEVSATTKIVRKYEGKSSLSEFLVGDTVEARGSLTATGTIKAKKVKNESISLVGQKGTPGTIKSIDTTAGTFVMTNSKGVDFTIIVNAQTRVVVPGTTNKGTLSDLKAGDVIAGRAIFNSTNSTYTGKIIVVLKRDGVTLVKPRVVNLEGKVTKLESTTVPTTIEVTKGDKVYMVSITSSTVIMRKHFGKSSLSEFKVGDKVRVIGRKDVENPLKIDAKVLKNDSLKSLNELKVDTDQDGIPDARDAKTGDHDNDGILDVRDIDDDEDGIRDIQEKLANRLDHDNDGIKDSADKDDDNDGIRDEKEDKNEEWDHDNDGTGDAKDTDDDEDGTLDANEARGKTLDHDNDGKRDDRDTDDDNDGVKDEDEDEGEEWDHDNDGSSDLKDDDDDGDSVKDDDEDEGEEWDHDNDGKDDEEDDDDDNDGTKDSSDTNLD